MKRRKLVALVSACVLLALGLVVVGTGLVVTRTSFGESQLRRLAQGYISRGVHGSVYLGQMSGGFLTGITIDTIAIRDERDSLFLSTGPVSISWDPRDLMDRRVVLTRLEVEHPYVNLRQYESGEWNFKRIFRREKQAIPRTPGRHFGEYVVIGPTVLRDANVILTTPWHPDDSLSGARLDSAVRYQLGRTDKEIRRVADLDGTPAFAHVYRWKNVQAVVSHSRLADPDSNRFGRMFIVDTLHATETYPPFEFSNVSATVRVMGDSVWVNAPHFDLPASTGSAQGKIWWGSDLPVRWDLAITGDSVSMADVAWVYPTLPTTGGGSTQLHIGNDSTDLHVMKYRLTDMDVRSTGSHVTGDMTFAVGGPVLEVTDVKLRGNPVDWDLLRTFAGGPFPEDWQGRIYGTVAASGGPLTHFMVDESQLTWRDAHVPGAVTSLRGRGELNIVEPALTVFNGFDVNVASLDLRSIEYLFPNFPRLGGTVAGTATLDSSWLDVRFSRANVIHTDGPGDSSHVTGSGRVTWGEDFMTYDVALQAEPLSLTTLSRSYPGLQMRGNVAGPIRAKGTVDNLAVNASFAGDAGTMTFDGVLDTYPPGFVARGTGAFAELNAATLLSRSGVPSTRLAGSYTVDIAGDSATNLVGSAALVLGRSELDSTRIYGSRSRLVFADGRVRVDTLSVESSAGTLTASGALGLPGGVSDSLQFRIVMDSLGGVRRYLERRSTMIASSDSLGGAITIAGVLHGRVDSLGARGTLVGTDMYVSDASGTRGSAEFDLEDLLSEPRGDVNLSVKDVAAAGVRIDSLGTAIRLDGNGNARFDARAVARNGATASFAGGATSDSTRTEVTFSSAVVVADSSRWTLAGPSRLTKDASGLLLDSLVLRNGHGGRISAAGVIPSSSRVIAGIRADSVPLHDVGFLAQMRTPMSGFGFLDASIGGTRDHPDITVSSHLDDAHVGTAHLERIVTTGRYRGNRAEATLTLVDSGTPLVRAYASIPAEVTLFSGRLLDDSLSGWIRADSATLGLIEAIAPTLTNGSGRLSADLAIGGTWRRPALDGRIAVNNGEITAQKLGITLKGIQGDLAVASTSDSILVSVRRLRAWSGTASSDSIALRGRVGFSYSNWRDPSFNLRLDANNFHAVDRRSLARLDISTERQSGLQLVGRESAATLSGTVVVDRGNIYLPDRELARKQVVDLSTLDAFAVFDSAYARNRVFAPDAPSRLVENMRLDGVQITLGDEVWLRSREANVKLSGALSVTRAPEEARGGRNIFLTSGTAPATYRLALEGTLNADRGTYTLDLGVVQREFQVQSGTITFQGTADNNPIVDITALYNVKRVQQQDLGVLVHIYGPFNPYPVLDFASNENYEISQSDLVSYLIYGRPNFELGLGGEGVGAAAALLLPTASSVLAQKLRDQVGSFVDVVQFQGASTTNYGQTFNTVDARNTALDFFRNARLGGEKQITNNLFMSVNAALCGVFGNSNGSAPADQTALSGFFNAIEWKLDYRFDPQLSLEVGIEPPSSSTYCSSAAAVRGLVPTPQQFGVSLFRTWRF